MIIERIIALVLLTNLSATAQVSWKCNTAQSKVSFQIKNFGMRVDGMFTDFEGSMKAVSEKELSGAEINFSIKVISVNTDNKARDKHLMKTEWFDAEKYPEMRFRSNSFKKSGNEFTLTGMLMIKGIEKEETFIIKPLTSRTEGTGKSVLVFSSEKTINRKDYGLRSGFSVSDEVNMRLEISMER
jgi:polyisoprenoid-binding protein YceI